MDQCQAYDMNNLTDVSQTTIQTPQTLDAMQEQVSFRYNQQHKLIGSFYCRRVLGSVKKVLYHGLWLQKCTMCHQCHWKRVSSH